MAGLFYKVCCPNGLNSCEHFSDIIILISDGEARSYQSFVQRELSVRSRDTSKYFTFDIFIYLKAER